MIRWDVRLYRPRIRSPEKVQVYWAFVIMAVDYKAALKQVKGCTRRCILRVFGWKGCVRDTVRQMAIS